MEIKTKIIKLIINILNDFLFGWTIPLRKKIQLNTKKINSKPSMYFHVVVEKDHTVLQTTLDIIT